ncbi:MAG: PorT family protein [Candidatus Zixiibacteriota bacterium]|nr:MAG: PorT family protein [candidate division Zixibacteria bacterium]
MKKLLTIVGMLVVLTVLRTPNLQAGVTIEIGPKFGLNLASFAGKTDVDSADIYRSADAGYIVGALTGGMVAVHLNERWAVRTEVLYSMKGADWDASTTIGDTNYSEIVWTRLDYVEIPVLAQFSIPTAGRLKPYLFAGPAVAFNIATEWKIEDEGFVGGTKVYYFSKYTDDIPDVKDTQFEVVVGGGLNLGWGTTKVSIEGRYTAGLEKAREGADFRHSVFGITAGISFSVLQ